MGIRGLSKLIADHAPAAARQRRMEDYRGRVIAIDASMSLYQFLIVIGRKGTELLTNHAGEVTSHLQGMFNRTVRLLEAGIMPVYVFDGPPPVLKKRELAKRLLKREQADKDLSIALEGGNNDVIERFSKRTVKVTRKHIDDCVRLLTLMGIPTVEAPGEAEAQCAALCKSRQVYAVASEDMDALTFGTSRFLRHLMDPAVKKTPVIEIDLLEVLNELELTMDQFIDLCILSGCDYCDSIKGIGGRRAFKLIHQHGCLEEIVKSINIGRYQVPEDWAYVDARKMFKEPDICSEMPEFIWNPPDEEGLVEFLVAENNFNLDRVSTAFKRIESAQNNFLNSSGTQAARTVVSSVPKSSKESRCYVSNRNYSTSGSRGAPRCSTASWRPCFNPGCSRLQMAGPKAGYSKLLPGFTGFA